MKEIDIEPYRHARIRYSALAEGDTPQLNSATEDRHDDLDKNLLQCATDDTRLVAICEAIHELAKRNYKKLRVAREHVSPTLFAKLIAHCCFDLCLRNMHGQHGSEGEKIMVEISW